MKKEKNNIQILIGEGLKDIRTSLGLTQEEVAESLGLAPRYLSDIERNKTKGSLTTLVKLCNFNTYYCFKRLFKSFRYKIR